MDPYLYNYYYANALLGLTLLIWLLYSAGIERISTQSAVNASSLWIVSSALILFIGTRPISGAFIDMTTYADSFMMAQERGRVAFESDPVFSLLVQVNADYFTLETFFFSCAVLYILPMAIATNRWHGNWGFAAFLALVGAFSFFSYGVNGIRSGIAASLAILAIAYHDRKILFVLVGALAIGVHKSMALPLVLFACTYVVKAPWLYVTAWIACLCLNLAVGERLSLFVGNLLPAGDSDLRMESYFGGQGADKGGFRFDFILYSIVPVIISHLTASPRARAELFYRRILCTYLGANAFWLLTMYAAYSNRFAYLSWCLLPWVLLAPHLPSREQVLSGKSYPEKPSLVGGALLAHYSFTYIMFMFVYR